MAQAGIQDGELLKRLKALIDVLEQQIQPGSSPGQAKIPGGITVNLFVEAKNFLENILQDLGDEPATKPRWVSLRLNVTDRDYPSPVFVGFVWDEEKEKERIFHNVPDPGLYRLLDDHNSTIYRDCLRNWPNVQRRNWNPGKDLVNPKTRPDADSKCLDLRAGVMFRRSIAIKVDNRLVGTLNAGFDDNPPQRVEDRMTEIAQTDFPIKGESLGTFLESRYILGGPLVRK